MTSPHIVGRLFARARIEVARRLPDKPVRRDIRGVEIVLPRAHALPYMARRGTPYLENMLDLARSLTRAEGELSMLDIGANVGDTAMMLLSAAPGTVVCVEPDPMWHDYLNTNVGPLGNVAVEHSVLVAAGTEQTSGLAISRADVGSSIVKRTDGDDGLPTIGVDELLVKYPQLADVRLIKTDTDGYDVMLVQAVTDTLAGSKPVVFFEFDPRPTRVVTPEYDPIDLWPILHERGYEKAVVWDNGGRLVGTWDVAEIPGRSAVLELSIPERGYGFWDVAVAHRDDPVGLAAIEYAAAESRRTGAVFVERAGA